MSNKQPASKEELEQAYQSPEKLLEYLEEKALNHRHYKCYTTYEYLKNWIEEKGLFLVKPPIHWNDPDDKERVDEANPNGTNFCKCFTFSESENVAMWMLYGGIRKTGAMIDYEAKGLHNLVKRIEKIELGYWQDDKFRTQEVLHKGEFTVTFTDMLYCAPKNKDQCTVKRSDDPLKDIPTSYVEKLGWRQKAFPWLYENECRLMISVDRKFDKKITTACIRAEKLYRATENKKRIYDAPNSKENKFAQSTLQAHIDWDLCKGCTGPEQQSENAQDTKK